MCRSLYGHNECQSTINARLGGWAHPVKFEYHRQLGQNFYSLGSMPYWSYEPRCTSSVLLQMVRGRVERTETLEDGREGPTQQHLEHICRWWAPKRHEVDRMAGEGELTFIASTTIIPIITICGLLEWERERQLVQAFVGGTRRRWYWKRSGKGFGGSERVPFFWQIIFSKTYFKTRPC